jgi:hypothetical protein
VCVVGVCVRVSVCLRVYAHLGFGGGEALESFINFSFISVIFVLSQK